LLSDLLRLVRIQTSFLSLEYMDYPMGNHGLDFKAQLKALRRVRLNALSFGGGLTLLMMIPVLNFAAMPAAVAGATAMWCGQRTRLLGGDLPP